MNESAPPHFAPQRLPFARLAGADQGAGGELQGRERTGERLQGAPARCMPARTTFSLILSALLASWQVLDSDTAAIFVKIQGAQGGRTAGKLITARMLKYAWEFWHVLAARAQLLARMLVFVF